MDKEPRLGLSGTSIVLTQPMLRNCRLLGTAASLLGSIITKMGSETLFVLVAKRAQIEEEDHLYKTNNFQLLKSTYKISHMHESVRLSSII